VDVEEFEPEVLDSPQEAVQGGLVGSGAPQHRRIAHRAQLRVVEGCPHPGTSDTAEGDHIGSVGHISRIGHSCREPLDGVSCPHPFRVCRSNRGQAWMIRPGAGQDAGWDVRPWHLRARRDGVVMIVYAREDGHVVTRRRGNTALAPVIRHYTARLDICYAVSARTVGAKRHRCSRPRQRRNYRPGVS
jgi:hypothetical protein